MGYTLKDKQREVILSFARGRDVFVSLPGRGEHCQGTTRGTVPARFFSPESLLIVEAWRDMLQTEIDYNSNKIYFEFYCN